ncbi:hypothetical protein F2P79_024047 [Pimephales promelas]|nr:hypothetical protein F2P79_024047 [Pimephales promelas]
MSRVTKSLSKRNLLESPEFPRGTYWVQHSTTVPVCQDSKGLTLGSAGYRLPWKNRWSVEIAHSSLLGQIDRLWEDCWAELGLDLCCGRREER